MSFNQSSTESAIIGRTWFAKNECLRLSGSVTSSLVDSELARYYDSTDEQVQLLFDLKGAEYLDIAALLNCIAVMVQREEMGLRNFIGYPQSKKVRDFLQLWRFREAVEAAVRKPFDELILPEDKYYLSDTQTSYRGVGDGITALEYDPDWDASRATKRNFFEFTTFTSNDRSPILPDGPLAAAARMESKRWANVLIREVLREKLGHGTTRDDVARVIVYEAISNAIKHPKAQTIQTVSKFNQNKQEQISLDTNTNYHGKETNKRKSKGNLRICVWDDGEIIANTLADPLKNGKSVRVMKLPSYMSDRIFVQLRDFNGTVQNKAVYDQSEDPTTQSIEAQLLLSSLYPGISRTASDPIPATEPFEDMPDETIAPFLNWAPGMGLYSLLRTVLDQFQGDLLIRSGNHRLSIEVAHDAVRRQYNARYKCKITKYPDKFPPFKGNLLVIQLPIVGKD